MAIKGSKEVIEELRKLSGSIGDDLSAEAAIRLTLSVLLDLTDKLDCYTAENSEIRKQLLSAHDEQLQSVDQLTTSIDGLAQDVKKLEILIVDNPLVNFGKHLKEHPKLTYLYLAVIFILLNIWLLPEFRLAFLSLIGISKDIFSIIP